MQDETKTNLTRESTWFRLIHMIVLIIAFNIAELVIGAVVVFQFLSKLLIGKVNAHLKAFGAEIGVYLSCIVRFLTFETEDKPFPYAPWAAIPDGAGQGQDQAPTAPHTRETKRATVRIRRRLDGHPRCLISQLRIPVWA